MPSLTVVHILFSLLILLLLFVVLRYHEDGGGPFLLRAHTCGRVVFLVMAVVRYFVVVVAFSWS